MAGELKGTLVFDIESHGAELLYTTPPEDFVRIIGYRWLDDPDDEVRITTDIAEIRAAILSSRWIVGHNIHSFDLPAVFGVRSDIPLELAIADRVYDTWTHAVLVHQAPFQYENRLGRTVKGDRPEQMSKWYSLDEQAHQLGVPGKTDDIKLLAKEFGGFGLIPVDEPRYIEYLKGDVLASQHIAKALLSLGPLDAYALREQEIEARKAVIEANGFRVDEIAAKTRVDQLAARREVILAGITEKYGLPTEGKAPWATKDGKAAILAALADQGVTPDQANWPKSAKTGDPSLGGEILIAITDGTPAEDLGRALAELKGQRSLAQLALDSQHTDGFAHPRITMLQRSGRWSTTKPGLTVWTARGPGAVEKRYFLPDNSDEVLVEFDYSNADARVVASLSGDTVFAERFEPGQDGHMINAIAAWGADVVATDPEAYRQRAKAPGHGWGYRIGAKKCALTTGLPLEEAKHFLGALNAEYTGVVRWQDQSSSFAQRNGYVVNEWGRTMRTDPGREFTQGPALLGQSGTREIVCDALLRMSIPVLRRLKAQIHDALVFSLPRDTVTEWTAYLVELMESEINPQGGLRMSFPVTAGPPAVNWHEAGHR